MLARPLRRVEYFKIGVHFHIVNGCSTSPNSITPHTPPSHATHTSHHKHPSCLPHPYNTRSSSIRGASYVVGHTTPTHLRAKARPSTVEVRPTHLQPRLSTEPNVQETKTRTSARMRTHAFDSCFVDGTRSSKC